MGWWKGSFWAVSFTWGHCTDRRATKQQLTLCWNLPSCSGASSRTKEDGRLSQPYLPCSWLNNEEILSLNFLQEGSKRRKLSTSRGTLQLQFQLLQLSCLWITNHNVDRYILEEWEQCSSYLILRPAIEINLFFIWMSLREEDRTNVFFHYAQQLLGWSTGPFSSSGKRYRAGKIQTW